MATCPSCPQACMTSTSRPRYVLRAVEAKGSPCGSLTGKASMSARSATTGPGRLPRRNADHPGSRNTGPDLQAQAAQVLGHQSGCALFLVAEFGVGMDVPPPGDHLSFLRSGLLRDFLLEARRLGCEGNHRAAPCESERDQAAEGFGRGHACTSRAMAVQPAIIQLRPKNGTWVPVENRRDKLLRAIHRSESARTETRKSGK